MLVLCLMEATNGKWQAAWVLVGSVIRLLLVMSASAQQRANGTALASLGFSAIPQADSASASLHSTILAAFVLESTLASTLGLAPHLSPDEVGPIGSLHEDGLEEWAPWSDPLGQFAPAKAPARAFSTMNTLVRMTTAAYDEKGRLRHDATASMGAAPFQRTVSMLIQNATLLTNRRHPKEVVAACEAGNTLTGASPSTSVQSSTRRPQSFAYMSVPTHDTSESGLDTLPADVDARAANTSWQQEAGQMPQQLPDLTMVDSNTSGGNLFEELALLERTDSSQHPQFMQNLGFAPDLDLAEFFGPDYYQPSDPLLAYMQPSFFNDLPNPTAGGAADAG